VTVAGGDEVSGLVDGADVDGADVLDVDPPLVHAAAITARHSSSTDVRPFMTCSFR
jgi:hypothetical protein